MISLEMTDWFTRIVHLMLLIILPQTALTLLKSINMTKLEMCLHFPLMFSKCLFNSVVLCCWQSAKQTVVGTNHVYPYIVWVLFSFTWHSFYWCIFGGEAISRNLSMLRFSYRKCIQRSIILYSCLHRYKNESCNDVNYKSNDEILSSSGLG